MVNVVVQYVKRMPNRQWKPGQQIRDPVMWKAAKEERHKDDDAFCILGKFVRKLHFCLYFCIPELKILICII